MRLLHNERVAPWLVAVALSACAGAQQRVDGGRRDAGSADRQVGDAAHSDLRDDIPSNVIFVSPVGLDGPSCGGTPQSPCQTLTQGITRAASYLPPRSVIAAGGTYVETVVLKEGVHLLGGYNAEFKKGGPGNARTVIRGVVTAGRAIGVRAEGIKEPTTIDSLQIESPTATDPGGSSYALYVYKSFGLKVKGCTLRAGHGAAGADGKDATGRAPDGKPGGGGKNGGQNDPEPFGCPSPQSGGFGDRGLGGAPATVNGMVCQGEGGHGGLGGVDSCGGGDGGTATGAPIGVVAQCDAASVGQGGTRGKGGDQDKTTCKTKTKGTSGSPGCDGRGGTSGADGKGGSGGQVVGGLFVGQDGEDGKSGGNDATGGGGGGGGGGGDCDILDCPFTCIADWGGGGGGGGSAGCPGAGGVKGGGGGGSFGIFIVDSAATIEIRDCSITTGNGGKGGKGALGQEGGLGGDGGPAGAVFQEGGGGGAGGKGGAGGRGGAGGGGAGGPSVGVYVAGGTPPALTAVTFTLGSGGDGGTSPGAAGSAGLRAETSQ